MRKLLFMLALVGAALVGCSDDKSDAIDAGTGFLAQNCTTYCTNIATACTAANTQFGGTNAADATAHCMMTCAKFPPGAATDMANNTLGCRLYHIQNITVRAGAPETHCSHAGPGGAKVDATAGTCGDACTNFCALETSVCGLKPASANGQYESVAACMTACAAFDKTHPYTVDGTMSPTKNPAGDSLACRMYHTTNASLSDMSATTHCPHTGPTLTGSNPCAGAATP